MKTTILNMVSTKKLNASGCKLRIAGVMALSLMASAASAQTTIAPPSLGEETKGEPAIPETPVQLPEKNNVAEQEEVAEVKSRGPLGSATIVESKRDSGQRYLIELEHSAGAKQYIEETDSDGKIESTSNDIEETPNLPKWKLGSW